MVARHLANNQADGRRRAERERFSGIQYEYSSSSWALWVAGRRVGAVEDVDAAVALIPALQRLGATTTATLAGHAAAAA